MRAGVADGMVGSLPVEEGYFLAFYCELTGLTGGTALVLAILRSFAIMLESV